MCENQITTTKREIIEAAANGIAGAAANAALGAAGDVAIVAGKAVIGGLVKRGLDDLFERYAKSKEDGQVAGDFEQTDHGASLLQEALNALLTGLDEERAEAVKKVFLGLAMNPVEDSMEKMQQLEIMRLTTELTMWEITAINMMDRYRLARFDANMAARIESEDIVDRRNELIRRVEGVSGNLGHFNEWMNEFCGADTVKIYRMREAIASLHTKHVFRYDCRQAGEIGKKSTHIRNGNFTDYGWKLVTHLRTATVD